MKKTKKSRILKFLIRTVVVLLAFSLTAFLTLPLWIGPVVKCFVNYKVPQMVKTEFHIDGFSFNQYTGRLSVDGVYLANPREYKEPVAVSIKSIRAKIDMSTVFSDKIVVEDMVAEGVFVSYDTYQGTSNITRIRDNVSPPDATGADAAEKSKAGKNGDEKSGMVIRNLVLKDIKLKYKRLAPVSLSSVTIANVGEKSGGFDFMSILETVFNALIDSSDIVHEGAKEVVRTVKDSAEEVGGKAKEKLKNFNESLKEATKILKRGEKEQDDSDRKKGFGVFDRFF
jgi:hypothetical protein